MSRYVIGLVTCASRAEARRLAQAVLTKKLAACVSIVAGVESHFWWQGKLDRANEFLMLIKTTGDKTKAITQVIQANHSYELPEIIFTPIVSGERRYLRWLRMAMVIFFFTALTCRADEFADLGSTNEEIRAEAAGKIALTGGPRAEKLFREMLADSNSERRQMAVIGLQQVSEAEEDLALVQARLQDKNATVRWSAALALGQSGWTNAVPALEAILKDDKMAEVREAAGEAVKKLHAGIAWARTLPETSTKPVLVYFSVHGSELCRQFEEGVLADPGVIAATRGFACVRFNVGQHAETAQKLDVRGVPTLLLLDARGNESARVAGLIDKEKLLAKLARQSVRPLANDVEANWRAAENYLDEGREDLAEPFLRNVIAHDDENRYGHTDRAIFALGFAFGKAGKHARAVYCMEQLLQRWPQFADRDKALYCLGLSQLAGGQKDKGRATLALLTSEFPASATAKAGQQVLEKLGSK